MSSFSSLWDRKPKITLKILKLCIKHIKSLFVIATQIYLIKDMLEYILWQAFERTNPTCRNKDGCGQVGQTQSGKQLWKQARHLKKAHTKTLFIFSVPPQLRTMNPQADEFWQLCHRPNHRSTLTYNTRDYIVVVVLKVGTCCSIHF